MTSTLNIFLFFTEKNENKSKSAKYIGCRFNNRHIHIEEKNKKPEFLIAFTCFHLVAFVT